MADPRWTDETAATLAEVFDPWVGALFHAKDRATVAARALALLADAGLLLPPAGTERTLFGHLSPGKSYVYACSGSDDDGGHLPECDRPVSHTIREVEYPDGSRWTGPWIEVAQ